MWIRHARSTIFRQHEDSVSYFGTRGLRESFYEAKHGYRYGRGRDLREIDYGQGQGDVGHLVRVKLEKLGAVNVRV